MVNGKHVEGIMSESSVYVQKSTLDKNAFNVFFFFFFEVLTFKVS